MLGVIVFFTGVGIGVFGSIAAVWPLLRPPLWTELPPATARQLARVRRRNRADLRHMRTAREAGLRWPEQSVGNWCRPLNVDTPIPESLPSFDSFDHEDTHR